MHSIVNGCTVDKSDMDVSSQVATILSGGNHLVREQISSQVATI